MRAAATTAARPPAQALGWVLAGGAAALVLGAAASLSPRVAVAATITVLATVLVVRAPKAVLGLLLASVFLEIVTVGGLTIARLVAPLAVLVTLAALLRGTGRRPPAAVLVATALYITWALASGLWTVSFGGTVYLLASLGIAVAAMLAFAVLVRTEDDLRRTFYALALIALPVSVYAVATFLAGSTLRSSAGKGDPNSFAAYELIALPLVLVAATTATDRRIRAVLSATAVFIVAATITTLSRGGLITLLVLVILVTLAPARAIFRSRRQKVAVVTAIVAGGAIAFAATGGAFTHRLDQTFTSGGSTASSGRINLWKAALTSIHERPALGLGYGTFSSVSTSLLQRTPGVDLVNYQPSPNGDLVHDTYLETLAELGAPGLVLFLAILGSTAAVLVASARRARAARAPTLALYANALLLSLAAWAVSAVFLSLETARPLWILIGLALALSGVVGALERPRGAEGGGSSKTSRSARFSTPGNGAS